MMREKEAPHFVIRLPQDKTHIKDEIRKIAKRNRMTLTQLITYIFEWFLEERKERDFTIKLK